MRVAIYSYQGHRLRHASRREAMGMLERNEATVVRDTKLRVIGVQMREIERETATTNTGITASEIEQAYLYGSRRAQRKIEEWHTQHDELAVQV